MRFLHAALMGAVVSHTVCAAADSLSLSEALTRARLHASLAVRDLEVQAREALTRQSSAWPNPRVSLDAENFAGGGAFTGADALETTLRFEQSVPLGGKRAGHRRLAEAEARGARSERDLIALELDQRVRAVFYEALAAQEREALAGRQLTALDTALRLVARRRAAGGGQPGDPLKLEVEHARIAQEHRRAGAAAALARARLAVWTGGAPGSSGDASPPPAAVRGDLAARDPLPSAETVRAAVRAHPETRRLVAERAARRAALDLARAARVPDLDINLGARRVNAGDGAASTGLVGGVSLPLPLWTRGADGAAAASLRLAAAEREERAALAARETEALALREGLAQRGDELARWRDELLPKAAGAAAAAGEAYRAGGTGVLDMLDGRRLLFETESAYLEALADWQRESAHLRAVAGLLPFETELTP